MKKSRTKNPWELFTCIFSENIKARKIKDVTIRSENPFDLIFPKIFPVLFKLLL